jgi:hypothetical protein
LALASSVSAEQLVKAQQKESPETDKDNQMIVWCSMTDDSRIYASSKSELESFYPCGKLLANTSCDAEGNRMISKLSNRPEQHRDCDIGPRIIAISHSPKRPAAYQPKVSRRSNSSLSPLTAMQKLKLKKALLKAEKLKNNKHAAGIERIIEALISDVMRGDFKKFNELERLEKLANLTLNPRSAAKNKRRRGRKKLLKQFDIIMKNVDRPTQLKLRRLLN